MIEREGRDWYLYCDLCPAMEGPFIDFAEALAFKQNTQQWRSVYVNGQWEDRCDECSNKRLRTKRVDKDTIRINFGG